MKYNIEQRLIDFAINVLQMVERMNESYAEIYLKKQLTRSSISPALNYGEAQSAESRADFIHKMRLCLKELRETQVCLKIIAQKPFINNLEIESILQEVGELVAIFTNSIKTAKKNKI